MRNVLFLSRGGALRGIFAESLLAYRGQGRFGAFSAGTTPEPAVRPEALTLLAALRLPTEGLRPRPWQAFAAPDAPPLDILIALCGPPPAIAWPGQPITAHWPISDPFATQGSEADIAGACMATFACLDRCIALLLAAPLAADMLARCLDEIGATVAVG